MYVVVLYVQLSLVPVEREFGLAAVIMRPASNATATRFFWISTRVSSDISDIFSYGIFFLFSS